MSSTGREDGHEPPPARTRKASRGELRAMQSGSYNRGRRFCANCGGLFSNPYYLLCRDCFTLLPQCFQEKLKVASAARPNRVSAAHYKSLCSRALEKLREGT